MRIFRNVYFLIAVMLCGMLLAAGRARAETVWITDARIQAAADVQATGEAISMPAFDDSTWHKASIPSTVLGSLVKDGV